MRNVRKVSTLLIILSMIASGSPAFADGQPQRPGPGGGQPGNNQPAPTPTPPPPSGPTQDQIAAARALGETDGRGAGLREGTERGPVEGRSAGQRDGFKEGFDRCEREARQEAQDRGFRDGYLLGQGEGNVAGDRQGRIDGDAKGRSDGNSDGLRRADRDALRDATGPGQQRGYEQANASDASSRGNSDGLAKGDADARAQAERVDYPRGRQDYRNERLAEKVDNQDSFNQKSPVQQAIAAVKDLSLKSVADSVAQLLRGGLMADVGRGGDGRGPGGPGGGHGPGNGGSAPSVNATPDNRYFNPSRNFPSTEETAAYKEAYRIAYNNAFQTSYNDGFASAYRMAQQAALQDGCNDARRRDYRPIYNAAFQDGRQHGYADAYRMAYDRVYRPVYEQSFRTASDDAYRNNYQGYYNQHFEEARSRAYQERYGELYNAAFNQAHDAKFAEMYPQYAASAYKRGRADEAQDFTDRPVRLLSAEATETIQNGVFEPGEELRVRLQMRNFADSALAGRDIKVTLQALDAASAVISEAESSLVQNLRRKSVTTVSEALSFRMNENAVNRAKNFRVTLTYQNRNVGEANVQIVTKFMVNMDFAESPQLKEGLQSTLKIRVRNQSNKPTDAGFKVSFRSNPELLQILQDTVQVGILNAGEERVIEFPVIARQGGAYLSIPVVFEAKLAGGRRVGLIDEDRSIPLVNDYRIDVGTGVRNLRNAGITRVEYTIRNVSSRLVMKGIQLKAKVISDNADNFVVVGPNPQYLAPLIQGQAVTFIVPVMAKAVNQGGTLEIEVQEDGRSVVITRAEF